MSVKLKKDVKYIVLPLYSDSQDKIAVWLKGVGLKEFVPSVLAQAAALGFNAQPQRPLEVMVRKNRMLLCCIVLFGLGKRGSESNGLRTYQDVSEWIGEYHKSRGFKSAVVLFPVGRGANYTDAVNAVQTGFSCGCAEPVEIILVDPDGDILESKPLSS